MSFYNQVAIICALMPLKKISVDPFIAELKSAKRENNSYSYTFGQFSTLYIWVVIPFTG